MIDEDLRREQRLAAIGSPSLRRLGELTRLATALEKHGRSRPAVAFLQLPAGTVLPEEAVRRLSFELHGEWEFAAGHLETLRDARGEPVREVRIGPQDLVFRYRGLERFEKEKPLEPTFEVGPNPKDGVVRRLWVPGARLVWRGFVGYTESADRFELNASVVVGSCLISNYEGPVVLTFVVAGPWCEATAPALGILPTTMRCDLVAKHDGVHNSQGRTWE